MPIELDRRSVTHTHVCGASHFSIFDAPFRENLFGNRFWENRAVATCAISAYSPAVSLRVPLRERSELPATPFIGNAAVSAAMLNETIEERRFASGRNAFSKLVYRLYRGRRTHPVRGSYWISPKPNASVS